MAPTNRVLSVHALQAIVVKSTPSESTDLGEGSVKEFDLSEIGGKFDSDVRSAIRWIIPLGGVMLLGGAFMVYTLITGNTRPGLPLGYIVAPAAVLLLIGTFFTGSGVYWHRNLGFCRLEVSPEAVIFTYRGSRGSILFRWIDPRFYLHLVIEGPLGMADRCYDFTHRWAPRALSEDSVNAVVAEARAKGLNVRAGKSWGGIRTHYYLTHSPRHDPRIGQGLTP